MGRHVLAVQAHCGSVKLDLFNTHLESTKEHAEERGNQLKQCLAQVGSRPSERVSILAGDLNLRDAELVASGGLPERTVDVWEKCGARKEVQYTWDMTRNTNLQVSHTQPELCYQCLPFRQTLASLGQGAGSIEST